MRPLTIERLAVWILFILLFAMAMRVPIDTDTWWHLRSGEVTINERDILRQDIFSNTRHGEDWVNHSWGAQIILYEAYTLTGGSGDPADTGTIGLALFTTVLATAGMFLIYQMCSGTVYSRMFVLVIGAATAAVFWSARPQMFSFFFGTVTLYILHQFKYKSLDRLWFIPILMILWVNLHAGFAIGFIFLFAFLAGEVIGKVLNHDDEYTLTWRQLRKIAVVTGIGILTLSINPFGPQMIWYPFTTAGLQTLNLFIQEWRSPDFKMPQTWPFLLLLGAIIVLGSRTQKRFSWSALCLVAGTAALALWSARNIAVFAIAATPVLSWQVEAWLTERNWQIKPSQQVTPFMIRMNWAILALVILVALVIVAGNLNAETVQEAHDEFLPTSAAKYLRENPPHGRMFNEYNWGGYFIFTVPNIPVFVDGRTDLYGDDFLKKYVRAILGAEEWRDPLEEYDIEMVVIPDNSALATLLRENLDEWEIVYQDDLALIFERKDTP